MHESIVSRELALFGGTPLFTDHSSLRIPWPRVDKDDREAVLAAFERWDFSGRGSMEVYLLEEEMAKAFGMPFATALNSCTAAIHAALFALGIGIDENDEVIVPNLTFIAGAMAVIHTGAKPVFADICPHTYNVTPETISCCITEKTRAVIVVHMHGIPAQIEEIMALCRDRGIFVIEDVAQSPGATYRGKRVGSFGDCSVFSLMSQKNLATCGECGILLSRTLEHKNRSEMLRIYGEIIRAQRPRSYNSYTIGYNYTLNPIQAAMARTQLKKFDKLTAEISESASVFEDTLKLFSWICSPFRGEDYTSVYHFYRLRVVAPLGCDEGRFRQAIQDALNAEGLNVRHYQNAPLSSQPVFLSGRYQLPRPKAFQYVMTEHVIRSTFVLGAIGSSPAYILCPGTLAAYAHGLKKINDNIDLILMYAEELDYHEPWSTGSVISDSFNAVYETLE